MTPSSTTTSWSEIHAPVMPCTVALARSMPSWIASSKLRSEVDVISVILATDMLGASLPVPLLRHLLQLGQIVPQLLHASLQPRVFRRRQCRRARHDPDVIALAARNDRLRIGRVDVRDHVLGLDRPDELHAPDRVAGAVAHEPARAHDLLRAVEGAVAVSERRRDAAV